MVYYVFMSELECIACKKTKPVNLFSKGKGNRGYSYKCKECHNKYVREVWYVNNKKKQCDSSKKWRENNRVRDISTRYSLPFSEVQSAFDKANGHCPICSREVKLVLDHCHTTNKVRGFICNDCNWGLGHFKDNPKSLLQAIKYLKQ